MAERRPPGFTLIEVLVALALLAVAFSFAIRALAGGLDILDRSSREERAVLVARSELERVGRDIALSDGEIGGTRGGYSWRLAITPYGPPIRGLQGHRVTASVGWRDGRLARRIRLQTVRLGPEQ